MDLERLWLATKLVSAITGTIFMIVLTIAVSKWSTTKDAPLWKVLLGLLYIIIVGTLAMYGLLGLYHD